MALFGAATRHALAWSALALTLALPATAQTPVRHATVGLARGDVTRDGGRSSVPLVTVWANTDYAGVHGTPRSHRQWLDWGDRTMTSGSDIVGRFTFGYATTTPDSPQGLAMCLDFYEGFTGFCAEEGQGILPDATYCLSGLPGSTTGGAQNWIVSVELEGGYEFELPPGPFGFGMRGLDGATGPLLCYANGTSANAIDVYTPDVASGSCFTSLYGPPPDDYGSFWLTIETADAANSPQATATPYNGSGVNTLGYLATPPVLGETMTAWVVPPPPLTGALLAAYFAPLTLATPWGELLIDVTSPPGELLGLPTAIGDLCRFDFSVPPVLTLAGRDVYSQALAVGGGIELLNGMALVVGF